MSADDLVFTPVDVDADLDLIFGLVRDSEIEAIGRSEATRDRVLHHLTFPLAVREEHRIVILDGQPVGVMTTERDPHSREAFVDLIAVGDHRERVLVALLERAREFSRGSAAADPGVLPDGADPFVLASDIWQLVTLQREGDVTCQQVLEDAGLRMIRRFWTMKWDLTGGVEQPAAPPGVTRRLATSDDDLRLLHRIDQDAFSEHFGFLHEDPFEVWLEQHTSRPSFSLDRWWIAELDGEPVGMCLLDDSRMDFGQEYVGVLAVLKRARGRGIAGWLLASAGADAAARGITAATLNCDAENTTNATALYEAVGFEVDFQVNLWIEPVSV